MVSTLSGLSGFIKLHADLHIQMPKWRKNGVAGTGKWRRKMSLIQLPFPLRSIPMNDYAQDAVRYSTLGISIDLCYISSFWITEDRSMSRTILPANLPHPPPGMART